MMHWRPIRDRVGRTTCSPRRTWAKKDYGRALAEADLAVQLKPDDLTGQELFGRMLGRAGRDEEALTHFAVVVHAQPHRAELWNLIGMSSAAAWADSTTPKNTSRPPSRSTPHWRTRKPITTARSPQNGRRPLVPRRVRRPPAAGAAAATRTTMQPITPSSMSPATQRAPATP